MFRSNTNTNFEHQIKKKKEERTVFLWEKKEKNNLCFYTEDRGDAASGTITSCCFCSWSKHQEEKKQHTKELVRKWIHHLSCLYWPRCTVSLRRPQKTRSRHCLKVVATSENSVWQGSTKDATVTYTKDRNLKKDWNLKARQRMHRKAFLLALNRMNTIGCQNPGLPTRNPNKSK